MLPQSWRMNRISAIMLHLLAASVFLWGSGYKLSLYFPPQASFHAVPIAKLLSKNEQAAIPGEVFSAGGEKAAAELHSGAFPATPTLAVFLFLAVLALTLIDVLRLAEPDDSSHICSIFFHSALFVRPPPARL
jgi:hypothetical protein